MSISSELGRIGGAKTDIADAIEDMGVTVPSGTRIDGLATLIQSGVNGHIQDLNNPHQVTADQAGAINKVGDHTVTTGVGWAKFLEYTETSVTRRKMTLLIQNCYSGAPPVIYSSYINPADGTGLHYLIAGGAGVLTVNDIAFYSSNNTHTWYISKNTVSSYVIKISVLSSYNRTGTYVDLTNYWKSELVSELPSGAIHPTPCLDGAGNVIPYTYAKNAALAPVESSSTASQAYSVGEYLILDGVLYKVTTAIASGETITAGTNVTSFLISDHLENTSNPHNVTASQVSYDNTDSGLTAINTKSAIDELVKEKIDRVPDHIISTASVGWFKFLEFTVPNGTTPNIMLLIKETYGASSAAGVWSLVASAATNVVTGYIKQLSSITYTNQSIGWTASGNTISFYFYKRASSSYNRLCFYILTSINRNGTFFDISSYWTDTQISGTPSGIEYSTGQEDGAGNVITDTYVPNTRTVNGKALSSNISLTASDVGAASAVVGGTISLPLSWSGSGPYTDTATLTGTTATSQSMVSLQPTAAQLQQLITDGVTALYIENNSGTLTAYALGAAPSTAMTIQCTLTEVS